MESKERSTKEDESRSCTVRHRITTIHDFSSKIPLIVFEQDKILHNRRRVAHKRLNVCVFRQVQRLYQYPASSLDPPSPHLFHTIHHPESPSHTDDDPLLVDLSIASIMLGWLCAYRNDWAEA